MREDGVEEGLLQCGPCRHGCERLKGVGSVSLHRRTSLAIGEVEPFFSFRGVGLWFSPFEIGPSFLPRVASNSWVQMILLPQPPRSLRPQVPS